MANSKGKAKGADLQGLDNFSASSLLGEKDREAGVKYAPLDHFHEDEENARRSFDIFKLQELADSMEQINPATGEPRGILEPLQVSPHPEKEGHFIINGGNRRIRAAGMAGLDKAPYIVTDALDSFDKFVLNDQRENLSPLEIAMFIKARMDEKLKAGEIAKALGRQASYVSDYSIFFDMSDHVRALYDEGLCRSMQALALLHRAHKKEPEKVDAFCKKASDLQEEVTTSQVRNFVNSLKKPVPKKVYRNPLTGEVIEVSNRNDKTLKAWYSEYGRDVVERWLLDDTDKESKPDTSSDDQGEPEAASDDQGEPEAASDDQGEPEAASDDQEKPKAKRKEEQQPLAIGTGNEAHEVEAEKQDSQTFDNPDKVKNAVVLVRHDDREAKLMTEKRATYGYAWIKRNDDGSELELLCSEIEFVAVIPA